MREFPGLLKIIVVFSDQDFVHDGQSLGIAMQLSEMTGARVVKIDVPKLSGARHFFAGRRRAQILTDRKEEIRSWLSYARGDTMYRGIGKLFMENKIREHSAKVLLISAGNDAAPYNLAVASAWHLACASVGKPAEIGTNPFEFVILPEYEQCPDEPNILKVVTPPVNIDKHLIQEQAANLRAECRPKSEHVWAVFVEGGNKFCYTTPAKLKQLFEKLIVRAEQIDADLYVAAAKQVSAGCVSMLKELAKNNDVIRYLHIGAEDENNPLPALVGLADEVFCTEDSLTTISEIVTSGKRAILLRTNCAGGLKTRWHRFVGKLIGRGAVSRKYAKGTAKYDLIFDRLNRHGKLIEFSDWISASGRNEPIRYSLEDEAAVWKQFNEACRAAKWIAESLVE